MTRHLTEDDVLAAIPGLTRTRLVTFVESQLVIPLRRETRGAPMLVYRQIDFARIRLLCDLTDELSLDATALGMVINLLDQLHARRRELACLARAIAAEPEDVRARLGASVLMSVG